MAFSRQEHWSGQPFLTQGLNPCLLRLLHRRQILYHLSPQESHGQLWEGPLPRVCMCPCGWWASPVQWFAQNLGSSPGLAALVLEWRFKKWSKRIYLFVFVARLESWCFSLQGHFSMLCSMNPSPLQQLKPAPCPAQQSWGILGSSRGEVGAARRAECVR